MTSRNITENGRDEQDIVSHWADTNEMRTHSEKCWQWHPSCAIALLGDENAQLRALIVAWADADDDLEDVDGVYHSAWLALRNAVGR